MKSIGSKELIKNLEKVQGADLILRPDSNFNETDSIKFAFIECWIFDLQSFKRNAPDFLLIMIEDFRMEKAIIQYNEQGKRFYIGRSIELDSMVDKVEFKNGVKRFDIS